MADLLSQLIQVLAPPAAAPGLSPSLQPAPALTPQSFAIPNVHANFDPQTGRFRGAPLASAGTPPALPPAPPRPQPAPPPLPLRPGPQAAAPGLPDLPGTLVDGAVPRGQAAAPGGMPDLMNVAGQSDLIAQMRRVLSGGGPQPADAPPTTGAIGPFETTVTPAQSGPSITGRDVASFFRNLARGAAGADPTAPGLTAFAQGMAGSMAGMDKEARERAVTEAATEDREFERRLKTTDARLKQSRERREARSAEIANTKAVTEIMRELGGNLTTDQKFKFNTAITNYARAINPDGRFTPEEMQPFLEKERKRLMSEITGRQSPAASGGTPLQFEEGQTATGPNGQKIIFRDGTWQPLR